MLFHAFSDELMFIFFWISSGIFEPKASTSHTIWSSRYLPIEINLDSVQFSLIYAASKCALGYADLLNECNQCGNSISEKKYMFWMQFNVIFPFFSSVQVLSMLLFMCHTPVELRYAHKLTLSFMLAYCYFIVIVSILFVFALRCAAVVIFRNIMSKQ